MSTALCRRIIQNEPWETNGGMMVYGAETSEGSLGCLFCSFCCLSLCSDENNTNVNLNLMNVAVR